MIKLLACAALFSGAVLTSGGLACRAVQQIKVGGPIYGQVVQSKDLVADILPPPEYAIETYLDVLELVHATDAAEQNDLLGRLAQLARDYDDRHDYWKANLPSGSTRDLLLNDSYVPAKAFYDLVNTQFVAAVKAGDHARAEALAMGPIKLQYDLHRTAIDKVVESANADAAATEILAAGVGRSSNAAFLVLGVVLLSAVGLTFYMMFRQLRIVTTLRNLSSGLDECSAFVSSASEQIATSSQSLAAGASEQAASLEETGSSLEEISSMTRQNADTAHQASVLSAEAKTVSERGNTAMAKMNSAINGIQKSATETAKIIRTIDEIAFQTNLLALNAAVEAARAGEAGKGFAVVAEEVRNLAMRSAEAAKNTASLIEGSVQNARHGVAIAAEVASNLQEINAASGKLNQLISEIAAACAEQSQGVGQVTLAIQQMDKVTQANAATSEESAGNAEELSGQSVQLREIVTRLTRLVSGGKAAAPTAARPAPGPAAPHAMRVRAASKPAQATPKESFADFDLAA